MTQARALLLTLALIAPLCFGQVRSFADRPDLAAEEALSGFAFLGEDTRALQQDEFENPGYLWLDRGETLFEEGEQSCASCHHPGGVDLAGAASQYPQVEAQSLRLLNLAGRINLCRERYQKLAPYAYESDELLSLEAHVASLAKGLPFNVTIDGDAAEYFAAGRDYFFLRKGQLNLACNQCHDDNWGRMLRGDQISQGQPTAYPAYRFEWQDFGSLHRRFQDCDEGIRATRQPLGSKLYLSLELYLAWRAAQLPREVPGVRR